MGQAMDLGEGTERLHELSTKMLGKLLAHPGALSESAYETAVECALQRTDEMDGKDCVRVLHALAQCSSLPKEEALHYLGARLGERLRDISLTDMAELAQQLADSSLPDVPIFARLSISFSLRCSGASAPQLTKMAVAFSQARLSDRRLFPRLAQSATRQLHHFADPDLPAFLAAFATAGLCHEALLTASSRVIVARGKRLSALDLALVAFAYAQFFLVFPAVVNMLRRRLPECAHDLPPVRLAELAVSCARLTIREPPLLAALTQGIVLADLSPPLFGQVSRSLASLGIVVAPGIQEQLACELRSRLGTEAQTSGEWVLDVLECLGELADWSRRTQGGICPPLLPDALERLAFNLADLCPTLAPRDVASLYRCFRLLPPSLAGSEGICGQVHELLAMRATGLAHSGAFSYEEVTSVLFSQACLYPTIWAELHDPGPVNPRQQWLRGSWQAVVEAWSLAEVPAALLADGATARQAAALRLIVGGGGGAPSSAAAAEVTEAPRNSVRPVLLEMLSILSSVGAEARGPLMEGSLRIDVAAGDRAFCIASEGAFFRGQEVANAFEVREGRDDFVQSGTANFELCFERALEVRLIRFCGWTVSLVPFFVWRQLSEANRRRFLAEAMARPLGSTCRYISAL